MLSERAFVQAIRTADIAPGGMGAQAAAVYESRGFAVAATWVDSELRVLVEERRLVAAGHDLDEAARVACCVLRLPGR